MNMSRNQLHELPSVSEVLHEVRRDIRLHTNYITSIIQSEIDQYRSLGKVGKLNLKRDEIVQAIILEIERLEEPSLKNIINGTGVVLHTGFGRAPISKEIISVVAKRMEGYLNLEFDLTSGKRGERQNHISSMISAICGSEDSLIVNNNAASVLISLNTFAEGKEVIVSRGQEVEIGGSFRIPDMVRKSHCTLVEVGTTNRTHLKDYEEVIQENTGAILWAHTSNYVVKGFTKEVPLKELSGLARKNHIPLVADLGSGALVDLQKLNLPSEKRVENVINAGADVVTFSGDKLLGGPQAGLIVGKSQYIKAIHNNPLYRTYRCDKWTIALMEETLRTYQSNEFVDGKNLSVELLTESQPVLMDRAKKVLKKIGSRKINSLGITLIKSSVEAGSGSLPEEAIPSAALKFQPENMSVSALADTFRKGKFPVVGYIKDDIYYIDLKAVLPDQIPKLISAISNIDT